MTCQHVVEETGKETIIKYRRLHLLKRFPFDLPLSKKKIQKITTFLIVIQFELEGCTCRSWYKKQLLLQKFFSEFNISPPGADFSFFTNKIVLNRWNQHLGGEILNSEKKSRSKKCFFHQDLQVEPSFVEIGSQIKKFLFFVIFFT